MKFHKPTVIAILCLILLLVTTSVFTVTADGDNATCYNCKGTGKVESFKTCTFCNGSSYIEVSRDCNNCVSGIVMVTKQRKCYRCLGGSIGVTIPDCYICNGVGYLYTTVGVDCTNCNGNGTIADTQLCSHCIGGKITYEVLCTVCDGTGYTAVNTTAPTTSNSTEAKDDIIFTACAGNGGKLVYYSMGTKTEGEIVIEYFTPNGGKISLYAIADVGYIFEGWYEDGIKIQNAEYDHTFVLSQNRNVEARFVSEYLLLGDADLNSTVNIKDATAVQKHIANILALSDYALIPADTNFDGEINIKDATEIQKFVADYFEDSPIGKELQ